MNTVLNTISGRSAVVNTAVADISIESIQLEAMELDNLCRESKSATALMNAIGRLSGEFFERGQAVTEKDARLYQLSIEAAVVASGLNFPTATIVPSFESVGPTDYSAEAEKKKEGIFKRIWEWLQKLMKNIGSAIKSLVEKITGKADTLKKEVIDLKARADQVFKHKELTHQDGEKGVFNNNKAGFSEKDRGKHGRMDSSPSAKGTASTGGDAAASAKPEQKPAAGPSSKTVKMPAQYTKYLVDSNGHIGELTGFMKTANQLAEEANREFISIYNGIEEGVKNDFQNILKGQSAMALDKMLANIGISNSGKTIKLTPVCVIVAKKVTDHNNKPVIDISDKFENTRGVAELPILTEADVRSACEILLGSTDVLKKIADSFKDFSSRIDKEARDLEEGVKAAFKRFESGELDNFGDKVTQEHIENYKSLGQIILNLRAFGVKANFNYLNTIAAAKVYTHNSLEKYV